MGVASVTALVSLCCGVLLPLWSVIAFVECHCPGSLHRMSLSWCYYLGMASVTALMSLGCGVILPLCGVCHRLVSLHRVSLSWCYYLGIASVIALISLGCGVLLPLCGVCHCPGVLLPRCHYPDVSVITWMCHYPGVCHFADVVVIVSCRVSHSWKA